MKAAACLAAAAILFAAGCERAAPPPPPPSQQDRYRQPERLVAALGLHAGARVAEVGAGGGYLTPYLARAVGDAGRVVATDIDEAALAALRERARGLRQVQARKVGADAPSLEPGRYDLVLLAQVDHLLPDRAAYLRELVPALRPGGRIAVSNREQHRLPVEEAAQAAGLRIEDPRLGLPGQFLLLLFPSAPSF